MLKRRASHKEAYPDGYGEFLPEFPDQRFLVGFPFFYLSSGEFPFFSQVPAGDTPGNENLSVFNRYAGNGIP
jgi:hypothetical protein